MPHTTPNPAKPAAEPIRDPSTGSEPPSPSPPEADPGAAQAAPPGALFRALLDAGCDAMIAYTAEQQERSMASQSVAAQFQPLADAVRQVTENAATKADLADFATKADLANFATKADLADFATKADLANFATKADLANFATRADLARLEVRIVKWMFGAMLAQTAVIVALVRLLA